MLKTPVTFLTFNRPDLTQIVFDAIRKAQPKKLFVVADGPRFPKEAENCQQARDIIKTVDWDCEVITNYSEVNLGCKKRVASGIDWVFSQVEEAIILEDDCLPSQSFFYFCENLLEYYRDDARVMHISGDNFQPRIMNQYSYYFSKYNHVWGWATWRRAWKYYDVTMQSWQTLNKQDFLQSLCRDHYEQKYWLDIFEQAYQCKVDTWDYLWTYTCWLQNGLSILPNVNLVSNIGFSGDATHTKDENNPFANLSTADMGEIKHPPFPIQHPEAEAYTFDYIFGGINMKKADTIKGKIKAFLSPVKKGILENLHLLK